MVPDLRGHGASDKPKGGYHVARLAFDLRDLIEHVGFSHGDGDGGISGIGASLGAAILWCVAVCSCTSQMLLIWYIAGTLDV